MISRCSDFVLKTKYERIRFQNFNFKIFYMLRFKMENHEYERFFLLDFISLTVKIWSTNDTFFFLVFFLITENRNTNDIFYSTSFRYEVESYNRLCACVRPCVRPCVRGQISETTGWIFLVLGMIKDLYPPSMPVI